MDDILTELNLETQAAVFPREIIVPSIFYGGPQGSLHKKGQLHIKHCNLYKQKRLLQIKRELLQIKKKMLVLIKKVAANKKKLMQIKKVAANKRKLLQIKESC